VVLILNSSGRFYDILDQVGNIVARFDNLGDAGAALRYLNGVTMGAEQEARAVRVLDAASANMPVNL
jgi:hypothetical protein